MRYEGYSIQERIDDILDKISKYGLVSLTKIEKEFLDAYSKGDETESHNKLRFIESETIFEDDFGIFKFEFTEPEILDDGTSYKGTLYVPDLKTPSGKMVEGRIEGKIIVYDNGQTALDFEKSGYDVFDFCNGLEYELDSFIDYVVLELQK